jgi:hypothetical protein
LTERLASFSHQVQDHSHRDEGVADPPDSRIDHAAVPLAAQERVGLSHSGHDVRLADRRSMKWGAHFQGEIGHDSRSGHVHDNRAERLRQSKLNRES